MVSIKVSKSQFSHLEEVVTKLDPNAKLSNVADYKGHIQTGYIDADFEWRDVDGGYLVFTNEVKHGIYKFVSDDSIGEHLTKMLASLPAEYVYGAEGQSGAWTDTKGAGITDDTKIDPLNSKE